MTPARATACPCVPSFGRLRCLVRGCCHGRATTPATGIVYRHPRSRVCRLATLQGVPIHPTPLYSILWNIVIAAAMTRLWLLHFPLALIGGLRFYQWIALLTVLAGVVVTCGRTERASPAPELNWSTCVIAIVFGAITWFALGVDFPASNRRFARLA